MKYAFYGREEQIADLERLWNKRTSSFVTCRGRRRIGKSTLIERFVEADGYFDAIIPFRRLLGV